MHPTLIRSTTDAAHPSVRRPPGLGEEVEAGVGGDLDPSPSPLAAAPSTSSMRRSIPRLSVADLQRALRIAQISSDQQLLAFPNTAIPTRWVLVLGAHSGAGASTIALAIGEAARGVDEPCDVRLVEYAADPTRSGLTAAAAAELGLDATGDWRRGQRGDLTLYRRQAGGSEPWSAAAAPQQMWPADITQGHGARDQLVVVDLSGAGWSSANSTRDLSPADAAIVVLRASVPGVRNAEVLIDQLHEVLRPGTPMVAAVVGPKRLPNVVTAAFGPRLSELRDSNALVSVPIHGRLTIAGLTGDALPKSVSAAGEAIISRLGDHTPRGGARTDRDRVDPELRTPDVDVDVDGRELFGLTAELAR